MWRQPLDPRFADSNPAECYRCLMAIKIRSTPSFGGEIKPSAPRRKITRYVKNPFEVWTYILRKTIFISFTGSSCFDTRWLLVELPKSASGRIKSFFLPISFHRDSLCSYITWGWTIGPCQPQFRPCLTQSTKSPSPCFASVGGGGGGGIYNFWVNF
jgi:hypothetical protein